MSEIKNEFFSSLGIGSKVLLLPFDLEGEVVAVKFTRQKVCYDVLDYSKGDLHRNIPSEEVLLYNPTIIPTE